MPKLHRIPPAGASRRRTALLAALAAGLCLAPARNRTQAWLRQRLAPPPHEATPPAAPPPRLDVPWLLVRARIMGGGPNARLGLVQAQHIFGQLSNGYTLARTGLVRVRVPAQLIGQGDDGWDRRRFDDGNWMTLMTALGVPFKAVIELSRRASDEEHAAHVARLLARARPAAVIVGNEVNAMDTGRFGPAGATIERYLDQFDAIAQVVWSQAPGTAVQLYGEAYAGSPEEPDAFLRRVLTTMRQRGQRPPDAAGIHVYDRAGVLPGRLAGYRRLLQDFDLRLPLSVEELGPRLGIVESWDERQLGAQPAADSRRFGSRLDEMKAGGWVTEAEHVDLVAQHLVVSAATADQAQIFCSRDVPAELPWRRGLVSAEYGRTRPALAAFQFMQRLLNDLDSIRFLPGAEHDGIARLDAVRRDGFAATVLWADPHPGAGPGEDKPYLVPPYTFVCDARGRVVLDPETHPIMLWLPAPTGGDAAGAVRILI